MSLEKGAGSYFTGSECGTELLFVQACRAHNERHGVSVRATVSGHRSAVSAKNITVCASAEVGFRKLKPSGLFLYSSCR